MADLTSPCPDLKLTCQAVYTAVNGQFSSRIYLTARNLGPVDATNVALSVSISIPAGLVPGLISTSPVSFCAMDSTAGTNTFGCVQERLQSGAESTIVLNIPFAAQSPGQYTVNILAKAEGTELTVTESCSLVLGATKLSTECCSRVDQGSIGVFSIKFTSLENSPASQITVLSQIHLPPSVTIQFIDLDGFSAYLTSDGNLISVQTDTTGPVNINLQSSAIPVASNRSVQKNIVFSIRSVPLAGTLSISHTLLQVAPSDLSCELWLGNTPLQASAEIKVTANAIAHRA